MEPCENTSKSIMGQAASFLGRNGQSPLAADGPSDIQRSISNTPDSYTSRLNSSSEDETNAQRHRIKLAKLLKGKEEEWAAVAKRKSGPLKLLDLPLDILKEIIKEVGKRSLESVSGIF